MVFSIKTVASAISVVGTLTSVGFFVLSGFGSLRFLNKRHRELSNHEEDSKLPGVTLLKPLKGLDPNTWQSFCSHCEQDYPGDFQIVFGVSDPDDPAIAVVQKLKQEHPDRDIELLICEKRLGSNVKVSNLVQMLAMARHPILLVNDGDIRVRSDYLRRVVARLREHGIGLVTCLYRGISGKTLGSRLEALSISTDFVPGVLSALVVETGLRFGLGSTLAFRRSDLEEIGGFEVMLDYLADDYELGRRIAQTGKRVDLSETVVETYIPDYSMRAFFEHQIRWSRTIRDVRPWGYLGLALTFGTLWAALLLLVTGGATWTLPVVAGTVLARLAVAFLAAKVVLEDQHFLQDLYLLPLRDLVQPLIWIASFVGNRIRWRGDLFHLEQGRLVRVTQ